MNVMLQCNYSNKGVLGKPISIAFPHFAIILSHSKQQLLHITHNIAIGMRTIGQHNHRNDLLKQNILIYCISVPLQVIRLKL